MGLRRLTIAVAAGLGLGLPAAAQAAPRIAYVCGYSLCRTAADGSGRTVLVKGTKTKPVFSAVSVRDSRRVAYTRGDDTYLARSDGRGAVKFTGRPGFSSDALRYFFSVDAGVTCLGASLDDKQPRCIPSTAAYITWWRHAVLYGQAPNAEVADKQESICELDTTDTGFSCRRIVARAVRGGELREYDVSARGDLLVAAEYPPSDGSSTRLALFDPRSGRRVRTLTGGTGSQPNDHGPSFSPDGRTIVFRRGEREAAKTGVGYVARICTMPARGGKVRCAGDGWSPVWVP